MNYQDYKPFSIGYNSIVLFSEGKLLVSTGHANVLYDNRNTNEYFQFGIEPLYYWKRITLNSIIAIGYSDTVYLLNINNKFIVNISDFIKWLFKNENVRIDEIYAHDMDTFAIRSKNHIISLTLACYSNYQMLILLPHIEPKYIEAKVEEDILTAIPMTSQCIIVTKTRVYVMYERELDILVTIDDGLNIVQVSYHYWGVCVLLSNGTVLISKETDSIGKFEQPEFLEFPPGTCIVRLESKTPYPYFIAIDGSVYEFNQTVKKHELSSDIIPQRIFPFAGFQLIKHQERYLRFYIPFDIDAYIDIIFPDGTDIIDVAVDHDIVYFILDNGSIFYSPISNFVNIDNTIPITELMIFKNVPIQPLGRRISMTKSAQFTSA